MTKIILVASALLTTTITTAAFAGTFGNDYGTVSALDHAGHSIALSNGRSYDVVFVNDLTKIKVGERVQIMYDSDGDAVSITRSKT
jgi:hypothetical protein